MGNDVVSDLVPIPAGREAGEPMASADQLKALIRSHLNRDDDQFFSVAMQVAAHEAKLGHGQLAQELRDLIDSAKARLSSSGGGAVHISRPRGELASLLKVSHPKGQLNEMVLDHTTSKQLQRIIREQRHNASIREHGLVPRRKLLLVGPPGTGKTMTASALAGELGLPLFLVRLDALITKFMGETAAKLRQIFDAISDVRGVYFFDEFDAIGSQRGIGNDVGEIRRVLNSFLQMIEQDASHSLIIAATNHAEILDHALFRRFDAVISYHLPTAPQARTLVATRLGKFMPPSLNWVRISRAAAGLSFADVARATEEAVKEAVMRQQAVVSEEELLSMLEERRTLAPIANKKKAPRNGPAKGR
jgi:SpoVK/Ycf46/Vps4 family AAA+-type ATPase